MYIGFEAFDHAMRMTQAALAKPKLPAPPKDCRTCNRIACHDQLNYGTDCPSWIEKTYKKGAF